MNRPRAEQPAVDAGSGAPLLAPTLDGMPNELARKEQRLRDILGGCGSMVVAFSGGVDSAYLAWAATQVLGPSALCITADSPSYPDRHRQLALATATRFGLNHEVVNTRELERADYRSNPANRCYYCKHELYTVLTQVSRERGLAAIVDGNNADDRGDYRPGRQAAREFGVRSPLDEAGLTKAEIRTLAHTAGLPVWNEPASACLSSRIPYHSEVTDAKLRMIERAEAALHALGFRVCRVRHHDTLARIEIGRDELSRAIDPVTRDRIVEDLRAIGYQHVTVDLQGYRMGSLNDGLRLRQV